MTFFGDDFPVFRGENGIFFVYHPDGRPTGDAFVLFEKVEHGKQALTKHRQSIGKRYVELFQTSRNEVIQILSRYTAFATSGVPTAYPVPRPLRPTITEAVMQNKGYLSNSKDIIRLRGLPYAASVQDILDFLNEFGKYVVPAGVHMVYNLQVSARYCSLALVRIFIFNVFCFPPSYIIADAVVTGICLNSFV